MNNIQKKTVESYNCSCLSRGLLSQMLFIVVVCWLVSVIWQPTTDEGRARFEAGRLRYEDRRKKQLQRQTSLE